MSKFTGDIDRDLDNFRSKGRGSRNSLVWGRGNAP